ncbi:MAG: 6-carboxytetrahydropterin synthase [Chitinophagaceae bacterium]|nr:6-carboxytetrahydropterin synthase [Chitinophagaceae bacterium]
MLSVTKIFRFEAAHALGNYIGECKNIHGHSYELHVSVYGISEYQKGFVVDFKELKKIVEYEILRELDHSLILNENFKELISPNYDGKTFFFPNDPSAETLILFIVSKLKLALPENLKLARIKLYETHSSYAEWTEI